MQEWLLYTEFILWLTGSQCIKQDTDGKHLRGKQLLGKRPTDDTHSLFHARTLSRLAGQQQRSPTPVCSRPALNGPPGVMKDLELSFFSSTPGAFRTPSFPPPLWFPVKVCAADIAWLSSHHMSDPSPSPSHDDGAHAVLVAAGEKMLVRDGFRPEYSHDSSKALCVEGRQFVEVALSHSLVMLRLSQRALMARNLLLIRFITVILV